MSYSSKSFSLSVELIACSLHVLTLYFFFFSSRRRHTIFDCDWSSDVCSSDLIAGSLALSSREITLGVWTPPVALGLGTVGITSSSVNRRINRFRIGGVQRVEIGRASCRERV